jgi:hypothetical protein
MIHVMKILSCLTKTALLMLAFSATSSLAQGTFTLIGPTIRNGSLEDGVMFPWRGTDASVSHGPGFANHGEWFATVSTTASGQILRPTLWQLIPTDRSRGVQFLLSFDARNGTMGFDAVQASLAGFNGDGTGISSSTTPIFTPPLLNSMWQSYQVEFLLPEAWDGGGEILLHLTFWKEGAIVGITYRGYLDNIILEQIPEPSTLALLAAGGALLLLRLRQARRANIS